MSPTSVPESTGGRSGDEKPAELFLPVGKQVGDLSEPRQGDENSEDFEKEGENDGRQVIEEIESLCMNCHENGVTKLFLTKIPFFRELIVTSFYCDHCGFKNSEVQSAGEIREHGTKHVLRLDQAKDLQRQIVKSDTAILRIEELDLEIPPGRGKLTNVEGILMSITQDLQKEQERRKLEAPELHDKIHKIIQALEVMSSGGGDPFSVSLNDPAGNSWIEPSPLDASGKLKRTEYERNPEGNASLGLAGGSSSDELTPETTAAENTMEGVDILEGKQYTMPTPCPGCMKHAAMNMQMVRIPYFKQVIITAVVCSYCDYRSNDVKTGGEISEKGQRIELDVKNATDLARDILKSETCCLQVPSCQLDVQPGTMGGRFTTVEGLLTQIRDDLRTAIFDVDDDADIVSDSMPQGTKAAWIKFFADLNRVITVEVPFTVILEDPLANSYVQSLTAPDRDPQIRVEDYERTEEEEEDLGLTDMRTHLNDQGEYVAEPPKVHDTHETSKLSETPSGELQADKVATPKLEGLSLMDSAQEATPPFPSEDT